MKASIVDLRYKMKKVLKALELRERVTLTYHGKVRGTIIPSGGKTKKKSSEHPFFGMGAGDKKPVKKVMEELRGGRYRDL